MGAHRNEDNQSAAYEGVDLHKTQSANMKGPNRRHPGRAPHGGPCPRANFPARSDQQAGRSHDRDVIHQEASWRARRYAPPRGSKQNTS